MQKLISELTRLYLPSDAVPPEVLEQRVLGRTSSAVSLAGVDGLTRAMLIPFRKMANGAETQHWSLLCEVANALQVQLGLPAPAVSISSVDGYTLWLSLAAPVQTAQVRQFLDLLRKAYFPAMDLGPDAALAAVELPPCLNPGTGKWAAFIHPDLGASFADESGLEMAPPLAGQCALLTTLESISPAQFAHAMKMLQQTPDVAVSEPEPTPQGLLLKDATLDDIVRHLHARHIEPTFRHLIR